MKNQKLTDTDIAQLAIDLKGFDDLFYVAMKRQEEPAKYGLGKQAGEVIGAGIGDGRCIAAALAGSMMMDKAFLQTVLLAVEMYVSQGNKVEIIADLQALSKTLNGLNIGLPE